jgi:hypothetical protein
METKSNDYGHIRQVKIGFGQMPPHSIASVKVERLTALGESRVALENPVIQVGEGQLEVDGAIPSGDFLQYNGDDSATLFDKNWHEKGRLPVLRKNAAMPHGSVSVSITGLQRHLSPWLEVQFLTAGMPISVGNPTNKIDRPR